MIGISVGRARAAVLVLAVTLGSIAVRSAADGQTPPPGAAPALKDLVPKGWLIGVAINQRQSDGVDAPAVEIITKHFNSISTENLLKFQSVHPQPDTFSFDAQDRYVAFGRDRGMAVIGHNLVCHSQTPAWVWAGADGGL